MVALASTIASQPAEREFWGRKTAEGNINVGPGERTASLLAGGLLAAYGLSRGSVSGLALALAGGALAYRGFSGHCSVYSALGVNSAYRRPGTSIPSGEGVKIEESITIMRPAADLFAYWRKLENLPSVMRHLVEVKETGHRTSHWVAEGPMGNVEWDAEIITERTGEMIGWRSLEGSEVSTSGSVHFQAAPGNRGTEVRVILSYKPPAGRVGATLAWLMGRDPQTEIREDLRNFKRMMETGSLPKSQPSPQGSSAF
jgi:uncharacterized membrane protein